MALATVAVAGLLWLTSSRVTRLLHDWAPQALREESDGIYQLDIRRTRLRWLQRQIRVDSIRLTTDTARAHASAASLPHLRATLTDCAVRGLDIVALIGRRRLESAWFGCRAGALEVTVRRGRHGAPTALDPRRAFLALQQGLSLPRYVPAVEIDEVEFPNLALDFGLRGARGQETRVELSRLHWRMAEFLMDPANATAGSRALFSRTIELAASDVVARFFRPGSAAASIINVGSVAASLGDSSIALRRLDYHRTGVTEDRGRGPSRRDEIRTSVGRVWMRGIDVGQFAWGEGVSARRIEVDSLRIALTSDRRVAANPVRSRHRTPQQWIADLEQTLRVDSVFVTNGEIVYREHRPGRKSAGEIVFAHLEAVAGNLSHVVVRDRSQPPDTMTLDVNTELQRAGRFRVHFRVPLDAPRFDMSYRGRLGTMDADPLNRLLAQILNVRIASGRITAINFDAVVRGGIARGTITPRYRNLSVSVIQRGSEGVLGTGGIIGDAARGVATLAANWDVRPDNPENSGSPVLSGSIHHAFKPTETLPGFLWFGLRDGLMSVVRK